MDKTHYIRRSHEQGNYEITPTYTGLVVVTIKSLATGQTMKVYLDEPTQEVRDGINLTTYTGHFYEEEFMATMSDGIEVTGLPLMYPYFNVDTQTSTIIVIDTENHYYSEKDTEFTDPFNLASGGYTIGLADSPYGSDAISNVVQYNFIPSSGTSQEPLPFEPTEPIGGPTLDPGEGGLH